MAIYETIFILDSLLTPEEIDKTVDRVKELIEGNKGKIFKIDKQKIICIKFDNHRIACNHNEECSSKILHSSTLYFFLTIHNPYCY